jgi:hypothetical protein
MASVSFSPSSQLDSDAIADLPLALTILLNVIVLLDSIDIKTTKNS